MTDKSVIDVQIKNEGDTWAEATLTVVDHLIMLHSICICAQWPLGGVGIHLTHQGNNIIKLAFMGLDGISYQSFYFNADNHKAIDDFFKSHGFPMHKPINDEEIKQWRSQE